MADKAIAVHCVKHNGVMFEPGEEVQGVDEDTLGRLANMGAVKIVKTKTVANKPKAKAPVKKKS
ncbi:MAG: hypothetical protein QGF12_08495 [SAR202 cluster bacterium]|jgi:hypothetical protein|nr:hypothetical protein [SAR202 cluster bacterium]|tara:strand:- start:2241 stop:2432 length:192 start_codon:yes stop_codon:yes gene_type:complete